MEGVSGWGLVANGVNLVVSALELSVTPPSPPQGRGVGDWAQTPVTKDHQPCLGSETVIKTLKG